ncbi:MAG: ATP-binding protein [Dehalococcoidia bacterium]
MDKDIISRVVFENCADGMVVIDKSRLIRAFNPAMERLTGIKSDEAVGAACFEILRIRDSQNSEVCSQRCPWLVEDWSRSYFQGTITGRSGQRVEVGIHYAYAPIPDEAGGLVAGFRDISKIAEVEALRSSLLAGISHELQTPIAIIKAYASTLARPDVKWDGETIREKLHTIEEESDRLSGLVARLLFTSRLDAGEIRLNRMVIDLSQEVKRVAKRFSCLAENHSIAVDFPADFPAIMADPEKIEEVLANLLENAIKFSPDGGTVTITGSVTKTNVLVSVVDEGIGIWPETVERLFERFYRVEDGAVKSVPGTGLGLYICRSLIEAHGGKISAEGNPGKGACFIFSLPIHRTVPEQAAQA